MGLPSYLPAEIRVAWDASVRKQIQQKQWRQFQRFNIAPQHRTTPLAP